MISTELIMNNDENNNDIKSDSITPKKSKFKTPFWANYTAKIISLKKILIVMSVLHLLGLPLLMISYIISISSDNYGMAGFMPLSICCLIGALFCGFIIALNSFDYLYKKSNVDMIYALPLTDKQRFLSDYLGGLSVYIVPYLISVILTFIIMGLGNLVFANNADFQTEFKNVPPLILKLAISGLIVMIMFYTLTILITTCCGSMFEAIAYNVIINGLIPGVISMFILTVIGDIYGIYNIIDTYLIEYISYSSPIGSLIGLFNLDATLYSTNTSISPLLRWYLLTALFDVIYFFVAMFLYTKRKAEDTSKPFVFKAFYYIVMIAITYIIITIAIEFDEPDAYLPMFFFSAIVYFIFEVISNRGFKKFGWGVLRYFCTVIGVIVISILINATNGFGVEMKVPNPSSIKSVEISYDGLYSNYSSSDSITLTDKDSIKMITDFHKDVTQNRFLNYVVENHYYDTYDEKGNPISVHSSDYEPTYSDISDYAYYYKNVKIIYTTYLGRKIARYYEVSFEQYMMLKELSLNDEYIKKSVQDFEDSALSSYNYDDAYRKYGEYAYHMDITERDYFLDIYSKLNINSRSYKNLTYYDVQELISAYKSDLENRTLEDIMTPKDTYCIINGYAIFSSYTNTINFLEENSYLPPSIETELNSYKNYGYDDIKLYSPSDITCMGGEYSTSLNGYHAVGGKVITQYYNNNDLIELLKVAQPYYITTDKCYILNFGGTMLVIPNDSIEIAEKCYSNSASSSSNDILSQIDYENVSYLDCYLEIHDIWKTYFSESYPDYEYFIIDLFYGNINYNIDIPEEQNKILNKYYNIYWSIYYNGYAQDDWNNYYTEQFPNYEDYIWYILKDTFNQKIEQDSSFLYNDDTEVKISSNGEQVNL